MKTNGRSGHSPQWVHRAAALPSTWWLLTTALAWGAATTSGAGLRWQGIAGFGEPAGMGGSVYAIAIFDDGSGPALYAAGYFTLAGGVQVDCLARWDGTFWQPVGAGLTDGNPSFVSDMTMFDDGSGLALYVAGRFNRAGGVSAKSIARWDGHVWSGVGDGMTSGSRIHALHVFDDGTGPALYAGGEFWGMGFGPTAGIARWDGQRWAALGSGVGGGYRPAVFTITDFDGGTGRYLYVGGDFTTAGGQDAAALARWDGRQWSAVGGGVSGCWGYQCRPTVNALAVFDSGGGPALYVGGHFIYAGSVEANSLARWDGERFQSVGGGVSGYYRNVLALHPFDDGAGPALFVGGAFEKAGEVNARSLARWDGSAWSAPGQFYSDYAILASILALLGDVQGPQRVLHVGGGFNRVDAVSPNGIVRRVDGQWLRFDEPQNHAVLALAALPRQRGDHFYGAGDFRVAGGNVVNHVTLVNAAGYSPECTALGTGMNAPVGALALVQEPGGPILYAGGRFTVAGGTPAAYVAQWNGQAWRPLGSGVNAPVGALAPLKAEAQSLLFAGGDFTSAGGQPASHVAVWDGAAWSALGEGTDGPVAAIVAWRDQAGASVFVAGEFTRAGGRPALRVARWDGQAWSALGEGVDGPVHALAYIPVGPDAGLYAAGEFTRAGGQPARNVARWNGSAWESLGDGLSAPVRALAALREYGACTEAPAVYAAGDFARQVAGWNGIAWEPLGSYSIEQGSPRALAVADELSQGFGTLLVGGDFRDRYDRSFRHLARLFRYLAGDCNCDCRINNLDMDAFILLLTNPQKYAQKYPNCDRMNGDINGDGQINTFDIDPFVNLLVASTADPGCKPGAPLSPGDYGLRFFFSKTDHTAGTPKELLQQRNLTVDPGTGTVRTYLWCQPTGPTNHWWHGLGFSLHTTGTSAISSFTMYNPSWGVPRKFRWDIVPGGPPAGRYFNLNLVAMSSFGVAKPVTPQDPYTDPLSDSTLLGWVEFTGHGAAYVGVGEMAIVRRAGDPEHDAIHFGFHDDPLRGDDLGGCSALPDLNLGKLGDLDCNGVVNNFDIDPFVLALTDPAGYAQKFPDCNRMLADCNSDGGVNNFDIDPFVKLLTP